MCTRYYMELSPELRPYIEAANRSPLLPELLQKLNRPMVSEGEVRPGDIAPVIASSREGRPAAYPMAFGFPMRSKGLVLNARTETADEKPLFREAWTRRRCIVPASWYYEWQHLPLPDGRKKTGDRYLFRSGQANVTWLCGLYRIDDEVPYFVILTREAAPRLQSIHNRMPLILPPSCAMQWINPRKDPKELLPAAVNDLVFLQSPSH